MASYTEFITIDTRDGARDVEVSFDYEETLSSWNAPAENHLRIEECKWDDNRLLTDEEQEEYDRAIEDAVSALINDRRSHG